MSNYISVYDDVLKPNQCQHLIEKFEDSKHQWMKTELKGHRSFTEINLNVNEDWQEYVDILYKTLRPYVDKYITDNKIDKVKQLRHKSVPTQSRCPNYARHPILAVPIGPGHAPEVRVARGVGEDLSVGIKERIHATK